MDPFGKVALYLIQLLNPLKVPILYDKKCSNDIALVVNIYNSFLNDTPNVH